MAFVAISSSHASIMTTVEPGYCAVTFNSFFDGDSNGVKSEILGPGFYMFMPGTHIYKYDTKLQQYSMNAAQGTALTVLSKEGLPITVDLSINYRLDSTKIDVIHNNIGMEYENNIIMQKTRSVVPMAISTYNAMDFIATDREGLQTQLTTDLNSELNPYNIYVESVNIRKIDLPDKVKEAIEQKQVAEQEKEKMDQTIAIALKQQEQIKIEAEAQAQKVKIEADAEAYALKVIREELAKEGGDKVLQQKYYDMLETQNIDVMIVPEGSTPVISTTNTANTLAAID